MNIWSELGKILLANALTSHQSQGISIFIHNQQETYDRYEIFERVNTFGIDTK